MDKLSRPRTFHGLHAECFLGAVIAIGFVSAQTGTLLGMESGTAGWTGFLTKNAEFVVFS
jgi:hypothetical protein